MSNTHTRHTHTHTHARAWRTAPLRRWSNGNTYAIGSIGQAPAMVPPDELPPLLYMPCSEVGQMNTQFH
jgi:hypothetical protein